MRNLERIKLLKEYCAEEPQNPFNYYALALEYREFEIAEAAHLFDFVVANFPNYLPVYFPAAQFSLKMRNSKKPKTDLKPELNLPMRYKTKKQKKS